MIIGITGKIGSGKTTAAEYLKTKGFVEYSMAGPLKKIGEIFHFTHDQLYGTQEQKLQINEHWEISSRHFLQKFGTEVCRGALPEAIPDMKIGSTLWVRLFEIEQAMHPNTNYVISDIRFLDEAASIIRLGGKIIRIERTTDKVGQEHQHASEVEMEQIVQDFRIINDYRLSDLYTLLDLIVSNY